MKILVTISLGRKMDSGSDEEYKIKKEKKSRVIRRGIKSVHQDDR